MHPTLKIFEQLAAIPHGSYNEKAISDFLLNYALERGFSAVQDSCYNVVIKVPASPGCEGAPTVILQGHMDMVCVKKEGSPHNFDTDPLTLIWEGDILRADGTSLGCDDAFALCYCLALLDDKDARHPALEMVFTVEEEVSMTGAVMLDGSLLDGRILINLDCEMEGIITVSSAGGCNADYILDTAYQPVANQPTYALTVNGLAGGHSGVEIHLERGNANQLLGRVLSDVRSHTPVELVQFTGGTKGNAIPDAATAIITAENPDAVAQLAETWSALLANEYKDSDSGVQVRFSPAGSTDKILTPDCTRRLLGAIALTPCGPDRKSLDLDIVLSSNNLSIVETKDDQIIIQNFIRSSVPSLLEKIVGQMNTVAQTFGMELNRNRDYPGWDYMPLSPLRQLAEQSWETLHGAAPVVKGIHAGLEVGHLAAKLPGLDAISIGPDFWDAHTHQERMSITSFVRVYDYLLDMLGRIADQK